MPYSGVQTSSLVGKVMGLLAFAFLFACAGTFVGFFVVQSIAMYWIIALAGLAVLFILNFAIQVQGLNLFLLYLFTFLEGMSLSPLIGYYLATGSNILGEAFLITAITTFGLAAYAWTTKRDFTRLGLPVLWRALAAGCRSDRHLFRWYLPYDSLWPDLRFLWRGHLLWLRALLCATCQIHARHFTQRHCPDSFPLHHRAQPVPVYPANSCHPAGR